MFVNVYARVYQGRICNMPLAWHKHVLLRVKPCIQIGRRPKLIISQRIMGMTVRAKQKHKCVRCVHRFYKKLDSKRTILEGNVFYYDNVLKRDL